MRPADKAIAAATEIMQNRCIVGSCTLDNGRVFNERQGVLAYQESLANGIGNMLGAVALGWTYQRYDEYLNVVYDRTPLYATQLEGAFKSSIELIAPHVMFNQDTYTQIADGEMPSQMPDIIPRKPFRT